MSLITCPLFYLICLIELINYSLSEGDQKKYTLLLKISFPKGYQEIKKSINQFIYVNTWDGVAAIIRAEGSCMKCLTKHIMDFLYRFLSFNKQLFFLTIKFVLIAFIKSLLLALTSRLP